MGSINNHLRVLGIIEAIYGLVHVLVFLAIGATSLLGCSICASSESAAEGLAAGAAWGGLWGFAGLAGVVLFGFVTYAGLALSKGKPWARITTLIFAVLMIAEFPLGTAFAVYALWAVLFAKDRPRYF